MFGFPQPRIVRIFIIVGDRTLATLGKYFAAFGKSKCCWVGCASLVGGLGAVCLAQGIGLNKKHIYLTCAISLHTHKSVHNIMNIVTPQDNEHDHMHEHSHA